MNWHHEIRSEFTRLNKIVDDTVVEELAQHAAAAFEAARAGGESSADAEARVRALITSWCEGTIGPQRIVRPPLVQSVPAGRSWFAGLGLDEVSTSFSDALLGLEGKEAFEDTRTWCQPAHQNIIRCMVV